MRLPHRLLLLVVLLACATASAGAAEPAAPPAAGMPIFPSVQIDIEPGSDTGTFNASVRVFDLNSRRILATPQISFRQGEPGNVAIDGPGGAFQVKVMAGVDPSGSSAQWSYAITEQGVLIAESRGTVTLVRPKDAGY